VLIINLAYNSLIMPARTEIIGEESGRTFVLGEEINRGNHGIVYNGWEESFHYAIKVPKFGLNIAANARRLTREASIQKIFSRSDRSSHVVPVVLYDTTEYLVKGSSLPFLVMPVAQLSLKNEVENHPLPPQQAMTVFEHIAIALSAIHKEGYAHRDVFLRNVLGFEDTQGDTEWSLGDFGNATLVDNLNTSEGETPHRDDRYEDQRLLVTDVIFPVITGVTLEDPNDHPTLEELIDTGKMNIYYEKLEGVVAKIFRKQYPITDELLEDLRKQRKAAEKIDAAQRRHFT
jgi:serine/threonine protein kinase